MLALPPPKVRYEEHSPGLPHVDATVRTMARLALEDARDYRLRQLATRALDDADVAWKDTAGEVKAIRDWIARNVRYTRDPVHMELVQRPLRTVVEGHGDCDDMSTLAASMQQTIGIPTRFRTVGRHPAAQKHVFTEGFDQQLGWLLNDPVLLPRGFRPREVDSEMIDRALLGKRPRGFGRIYNSEGAMVGLGAYPHSYDDQLWRGNSFYDTGPLGTLPWVEDVDDPHDGQLALGACADGSIDLLEYDELGSLWSSIKKVGRVIGKVASKVASSPIAQMAASIIPGGGAALQAAGAAGRVISRVASASSPAAAAAAAARALPSSVTRGLPPVAASALRMATGGGARPTVALPSGGPVRAGVRRTSTSPVAAITGGALPSMAPTRYPPQARQLFDAASGVFRVFLPLAAGGGMAGMTEREAMRSPYRAGYTGVRNWGLGDEDDDDDDLGDYDQNLARTKAPLAIAAVMRRQAARTLSTPDTAIRDFQKAVGNLTRDGLYGPNTRAAMVYYVPSADRTLPPRPGATWRAPGTATPAGHAEIGREPVNPGLPPVAPRTSAPTAPTAAPPGGAPAAPAILAPGSPAFSTPEAEERAFAPPDPFAQPAAPGTPSPSFLPAQPHPTDEGAFVWRPAVPAAPPASTMGPASSTGSGSDNAMLWLAIFYIWSRHRR